MISLLPSHAATRSLIYSTLAASVSRGLFVTISIIYFTKQIGLTATQVGLGMTIAAVAGMFSGVPAGYVADRAGPRGIAVLLGVIRSAFLLLYLAVDNFLFFVLVACAIAVFDAAGGAARGALLASVVPSEDRVKARAILRSVTNVGWVAGAAAAGVALHYNTWTAYAAMFVICAAASLASALLNLRIPAVAPIPRAASGPKLVVLRDRPYLSLAVLNGILCIHYGMLNVAVPLWVSERTNAPAWVIAGLAATNATVVVFLQIRASRGTADVDGAARAQRASGLLLLGGCLLYALAAGQPAWVAAAFLFAGALVHVVGELRQAAGSWGIAFGLAPDHAQGQYQGLYDTGFSLANIIAPALLTTVVIGWGFGGWLLFGVIFAVTGLAVPPVARWAQRTRVQEKELVPA
ncbi:MFS transporter [Longispora albida]|uniref:MFS transporter n=1 Tax=Longispora albida TaxID=203523 RepID=UPI0003632603|nr:MFS transporter [Longispora albida]